MVSINVHSTKIHLYYFYGNTTTSLAIFPTVSSEVNPTLSVTPQSMMTSTYVVLNDITYVYLGYIFNYTGKLQLKQSTLYLHQYLQKVIIMKVIVHGSQLYRSYVNYTVHVK